VLRHCSTEPIKKPSFQYFSAWFCPYAHRCTLALEHHRGFIDWEWVEALGWESRPSAVGEEHDQRVQEHFYHWKSPELLKHNPSGLVPTLVDTASGRAVVESLVTVQFVDEVAQAAGSTATPLLPIDLIERAKARVWADVVNRTCCSPYYGVLVKADEQGRRESMQALLKGIAAFCAEMEGPFFFGPHPSLVDYALLPWAYRYYVLAHYKGLEYEVPQEGETARFHGWLEAMVALPHVVRTLPDKDRYIEHVGKYATGSARSKVANAVRRGAQAHEIDDDVDEAVAEFKRGAKSAK
jgi:glutathione S-transferase